MRAIKFGVSASLTGRYALQGRESFEGIVLWARDANRRGGIYIEELKQTIPAEIVHYDDESSPEKCRGIVQRLIAEDRIDVLLSPYGSGHTLAAAEVAERYGETLWNHGGSSDEISGRGHLISAITPAGRYMTGIIELTRELDPQARGVVIFRAEGSGFSANVARGAAMSARDSGFSAVEIAYPAGTGDFSPYLRQAESLKPDIILGVGSAEDDIALAKQMIQANIRARAVGIVAAGINEFGRILGKESEGFLAPSQWEAKARLKPDFGITAAEFTRRFKEMWGKEPSYPAAQGYNIGLIIEKCVQESGSLRPSKLREAAASLDFSTFYGNFKIDPATGKQSGHKILTVQWQSGNRVIVHPADIAEQRALYPKP
ncbi:MAG: amino acid ABC transporter substrate-binding protein [Deltaproteobacteria bacterium]